MLSVWLFCVQKGITKTESRSTREADSGSPSGGGFLTITADGQ